MIREFFAWYGQRMAELLPGALRPGRNGPSDALVIDAERPRTIVFLQRRRGVEKRLGQWDLSDDLAPARAILSRAGGGPRVVVLRLPGSALLERETVLPLAAEREADRVLRFELDRLTPFSPDELHWTAVPIGRDPAAGTLRMRLSLVPRSAIEPILAAVAPLGLAPALMEARLPDGAVRIVPAGDHEGRASASRQVPVLAGCCAVLALIAVALPFARQSLALAAIEARIDELKPAVILAEALRRRLAADPSGLDVVAAERARTGDALSIFAALTDILPDDTYLTGLSLRQRHLSFDGQSQDAARLIGLLSADPTIRNAAFASPVTKTEGGADTFSIHTDVAP